MWRRPSVPRTAFGWVSTDPASPVDWGSSSVCATPALGVDIPAAMTSAVTRTASGHRRRPDTRPTGSLVIWAPGIIEIYTTLPREPSGAEGLLALWEGLQGVALPPLANHGTDSPADRLPTWRRSPVRENLSVLQPEKTRRAFVHSSLVKSAWCRVGCSSTPGRAGRHGKAVRDRIRGGCGLRHGAWGATGRYRERG